MAVAPFDTLKFANTLKAAGVPDKQAEAMVDSLQAAMCEMHEERERAALRRTCGAVTMLTILLFVLLL